MTRHAREMRREPTDAERRLWWALRSYTPRFTRQLVIEPFILYLACREARLAIELDGGQHAADAEYDARRTTFLEERGWRVIRFWNVDVLANTEGVLQTVLSVAAECLGGTHPQPLPFRKGRRRASRDE